jgi:hypothetical protein
MRPTAVGRLVRRNVDGLNDDKKDHQREEKGVELGLGSDGLRNWEVPKHLFIMTQTNQHVASDTGGIFLDRRQSRRRAF